MLYISTRIWVLRTLNAGQNIHFQCSLISWVRVSTMLCILSFPFDVNIFNETDI